MKQLLEKIKNFFDTPSTEQEIEERFYQKLQDMKDHPENYQHIINKKISSGSKIPPVSLF
jgi:hypothetical protein